MDNAAHLAYLGTLAQEGFVVASVEYRTSNEGTHPQEAYENSPVSKVTPDAPPFLLIHGTKDSTVPFSQSLILIFICTGKPAGSFR